MFTNAVEVSESDILRRSPSSRRDPLRQGEGFCLMVGNNGEKMLLTWGLMDSQIPGMPPGQFGSMDLNCWCAPQGQRLGRPQHLLTTQQDPVPQINLPPRQSSFTLGSGERLEDSVHARPASAPEIS